MELIRESEENNGFEELSEYELAMARINNPPSRQISDDYEILSQREISEARLGELVNIGSANNVFTSIEEATEAVQDATEQFLSWSSDISERCFSKFFPVTQTDDELLEELRYLPNPEADPVAPNGTGGWGPYEPLSL